MNMLNMENHDIRERKLRPDDVLGHLPPDQKEKIILWLGTLSYRDTLAKIQAPPPEGLGIKANYDSLRRFYARHLPDEIAMNRKAEALSILNIAETIKEEPAPYEVLIKEFFLKHLFFQSMAPHQHEKTWSRNLQLMLSWRALELKEQSLELEKLKIGQQQAAPVQAKNTIEINAGIKANFESLLQYCSAHPQLADLLNSATSSTSCAQTKPGLPDSGTN